MLNSVAIRALDSPDINQAIRLWCVGRSDVEVSKTLDLPIDQVIKLTESDEWANLVAQRKKFIDGELVSTFNRIAHVALGYCLERLNKGDPHVLRDGRIVYKEVSAKDAAAIASLAIERRKQIEEELGANPEVQKQALQKLNSIADALGRLAKHHEEIEEAKKRGITIEQEALEVL